jgi:hypothetical protein
MTWVIYMPDAAHPARPSEGVFSILGVSRRFSRRVVEISPACRKAIITRITDHTGCVLL